MSFPVVNTWGFNEKLTAAQITAIALYVSRAVDAYSGGSYTLNSGSLQIIGPSTGGSLLITSASAVIASPNGLNFVRSNDTSNSFVGASVVPSASTLTVQSGGTFAVANGAAVTSGGNATWAFTGTSAISFATGTGITWATGSIAQFNSGSVTQFLGTLALSGTTSVTTPLVLSGGGCVQNRRVTGNDADMLTLTAASVGDYLKVPTITGNRIYKFLNTSAADGMACTVYLSDIGNVTNTVTIQDASAATICTLGGATGSGKYSSVTLLHTGSAWVAGPFVPRD